MGSKEFRGYPAMLCGIALVVMALSCAGFGTRPDASPPQAAVDTERGGAATGGKPGGKGGAYGPGQVLVKFREGTHRQTVEALEKELGLRTVQVVSQPNTCLMEITGGDTVERMIERLKKVDTVEYAEPNYVRSVR
jgi:hypothetical protein